MDNLETYGPKWLDGASTGFAQITHKYAVQRFLGSDRVNKAITSERRTGVATHFYWIPELVHNENFSEGHNWLGLSRSSWLEINYRNSLYHIGKIMAAGPYCYDCNRSLCLGDIASPTEFIRSTCGSGSIFFESHSCWQCGAPYEFEKLKYGLTKQPVGVDGCFAFKWKQKREKVYFECIENWGNSVIITHEGKLIRPEWFLTTLETHCKAHDETEVGSDFY